MAINIPFHGGDSTPPNMPTSQVGPDVNRFNNLVGRGDFNGARNYGRFFGYNNRQIADFTGSQNNSISANQAFAWLNNNPAAPRQVNPNPAANPTTTPFHGPGSTPPNMPAPQAAPDINRFNDMVSRGDYRGAADYGRSMGYTNRQIADFTGSQNNSISASQAFDWLNNPNQGSPGQPGTPQAAPFNMPAVDPATETVEGRFNRLLNPNSPLMQQARTRALQFGNRRGLLNSSITSGAAEAAMIDAAMPIAKQDAATYADRARMGAQFGFQEGESNLDRRQQTDVQTIRGEQDLVRVRAAGTEARLSNEQQNAFQVDFQTLRTAQETILQDARLDASERDRIMADIASTNRDAMRLMAQVNSDTSITADGKTAAIDSIRAWATAAMNTAVALARNPAQFGNLPPAP